jgi:L-fuconolactonase
MASQIIDIHPHVISDDEGRYPPAPLFGKRSDWSQERPCVVETLIAAMDEAGVAKAAVVHSSTTYGFDNSYVVDACARYPDRLIAVGSVDVRAPDAVETIKSWTDKGLAGLRIFTGGSTKDFDPAELEDESAYPAWELLGELGLTMCIQTGPVGLPQVVSLAKRFPNVPIILDHLGRPDVTDGPPYAKAQSLFDLADIPSIYMKLTPGSWATASAGKATPRPCSPSWSRCSAPAHGLGVQLPDLAGRTVGDPGHRAAAPGHADARRSRLDLRQDRADPLSDAGRVSARRRDHPVCSAT